MSNTTDSEPKSDSRAAVAFSITLVAGVVCGVALLLFLVVVAWKRRNRAVIAREPILLFVSTCSSIVLWASICLHEVRDHEVFARYGVVLPCSMHVWLSQLFIPLYFGVFVIQCVRLIVVRGLSVWRRQHVVNSGPSLAEIEGGRGTSRLQFVRNRAASVRGWVALIVALMLAFHCVVALVEVSLIPRYDSTLAGDAAPECTFDVEYVVLMAVLAPYILFLLVWAVLVKNHEMGHFFNMKSELVAFVALWSTFGLVFTGWNVAQFALRRRVGNADGALPFSSGVWILCAIFSNWIVLLVSVLTKGRREGESYLRLGSDGSNIFEVELDDLARDDDDDDDERPSLTTMDILTKLCGANFDAGVLLRQDERDVYAAFSRFCDADSERKLRLDSLKRRAERVSPTDLIVQLLPIANEFDASECGVAAWDRVSEGDIIVTHQ